MPRVPSSWRARPAGRLGDVQVRVSPLLPLHPSPGEDGRRIVRHGLADVLAWLGEPVGPRPGELTHVVALPGVVLLSPRAFAALRALADVSRTPTEGELVLVRAVYAARAGAA